MDLPSHNKPFTTTNIKRNSMNQARIILFVIKNKNIIGRNRTYGYQETPYLNGHRKKGISLTPFKNLTTKRQWKNTLHK